MSTTRARKGDRLVTVGITATDRARLEQIAKKRGKLMYRTLRDAIDLLERSVAANPDDPGNDTRPDA